MQCSWKSVVLLAFASIAIQYTAIRTFSAKPFNLLCSHNPGPDLPMGTTAINCGISAHGGTGQEMTKSCNRSCNEALPPSPSLSHPLYNSSSRTHILILATTRSGSSFVGQLLNQHPKVFYLFEPLYHVQLALLPRFVQSRNPADRRVMLGAARDLLRSLYHCQLNSLENYIRPHPANHSTDKLFRRGASRALCSPPVCDATLGPVDQGLVLTDEGECLKRCGALNVSLAAQACQDRPHMVIKTVRIPQVSDLRALVEDQRLNLKVIQLVRDPRGILASRIETFRDTYRLWRLWRVTGRRPYNLDLGQITTVCKDFLSSVSIGLSRPSWLRGKYLLLRYEDLAKSPLQKTRELYDFLGLSLEPSVQDWILNNTQGSSDLSARQKYGTARDSAANAESWRQKLSFDMVVYMQTVCQPVLELLGYKRISRPAELRNLSYSLVQGRTFPPFL